MAKIDHSLPTGKNKTSDELRYRVKQEMFDKGKELLKLRQKVATQLGSDKVAQKGLKTAQQEIDYLNKLLNDEVKEVPRKKKVIPEIKRVVSTREGSGVVHSPNYSSLPNQPTKKYAAGRTKMPSSGVKSGFGKKVITNTVSDIPKTKVLKSVISKSLSSAVQGTARMKSLPVMNIVSKVANSGVARATGAAGMAIGAAGDIMNISKATREVRNAIIHKPVEAIPRTYVNKPMNLKTQAQLNSEVGAKLISKSSGGGTKQLVKKQSNRLPNTKIKTKVKSNNTKRASSLSSSSKITPKRPDQITSDMSFLNVPSFTSTPRISPVRPIPTRVQLPEEFMGSQLRIARYPQLNPMKPSMSLSSLPQRSRKSLGVSRWR